MIYYLLQYNNVIYRNYLKNIANKLYLRRTVEYGGLGNEQWEPIGQRLYAQWFDDFVSKLSTRWDAE